MIFRDDSNTWHNNYKLQIFIDLIPEFETDFIPSKQAPQFIQSAPTAPTFNQQVWTEIYFDLKVKELNNYYFIWNENKESKDFTKMIRFEKLNETFILTSVLVILGSSVPEKNGPSNTIFIFSGRI